MKSPKLLCVAVAVLCVDSALSQPPPPPGPGTPVARPSASTLTRFNLDFPGGTPGELVEAIQKAMGKPLNAIVPDDFVKMKLPALKMNNVDVAELFQALEQASSKQEAVTTATTYGGGQLGGFPSYTQVITRYGFRRGQGGNPSDDSIWNFYVEKPNFPGQSSGKVCRFYSLAGYLERGATVDDITTAIDTGAKMLGEASGPEIRFHKDTKLLIAVGEPGKLELIDAVLRALDSEKPAPRPGRPADVRPKEQPKSDEKPKPGKE